MAVWGKLSAEPIVPKAAVEKADDQGDKSLPDPTARAGFWAAVLLVVAVVVGIAVNELDLTAAPFNPAEKTEANFALFAGFYVGAQVIERLMEFVSPVLPPWTIPAPTPPAPDTPEQQAARAAQLKADRGKLALGVASVLGVAASGLFGLFFLQAIGMKVSPTVDTILTGITIAAGTKPLHDFITLLQNKENPTTATAPK